VSSQRLTRLFSRESNRSHANKGWSCLKWWLNPMKLAPIDKQLMFGTKRIIYLSGDVTKEHYNCSANIKNQYVEMIERTQTQAYVDLIPSLKSKTHVLEEDLLTARGYLRNGTGASEKMHV
jgi:hypothetical protein